MKTSFLLLTIVFSMPSLLFPQEYKDMADKAADAARDAVKMGYGDGVELPKAVVRGRVFYQETGQPLRRSWIGFVKIREIVVGEVKSPSVSNYWEYSNAESVLTNDFGEFVMKDVEPGVYQAVLRLPGILNPTGADRESTIFQQFTFESGTESHIEVGVKRGGAVSGYIRYRDGAPLIAAQVSLLKVKSNDAGELETEILEGIGSAETDDRGYYRFSGLPEGEYIVLTAEPSVFDGSNSKVSVYSTSRYFSSSELKTYFPNGKTAFEASKLQVYPGEELSDIDIMLASRELYEVSGLVVGSKDNKLIDGIEIEFEKAGETGEPDYQTRMIRTTTTDENGRWMFKDLQPGEYVAKISEPSYRRYRDEEEEAPLTRPNYASTKLPFEVTPGENRDVIFRISVEGSISGVVSVEGNRELPDTVSVHADTKKERVSSNSVETTDYSGESARQKTRGDFTVDDLKAGEYYLTVKAGDGYFAKSITYQGKDVSDAPIVIRESQQLKDVRVVLSSGFGTVEGKVTDAEPTAYLYVYLMPAKENTGLYRAFLEADSDYVGDDNAYEIKAQPGEYYLFVKDESAESPKQNATEEELEAYVRNLLKDAQRITIVRGQTRSVDLNSPK